MQESPVRLGTKPRLKASKDLHPRDCTRQDTPISAGIGHTAGEATPPPRIVVSVDDVFSLPMLLIHKEPGTPHQVVNTPQTPQPKKRSEGWMTIVCATPQLSMNSAMVGIRESYASPDKPSSPHEPTQEICSVGESDLEEEEEGVINVARRPSFKTPWTTPIKATSRGSLFTPVRPGKRA
jgi:hypothetical protein